MWLFVLLPLIETHQYDFTGWFLRLCIIFKKTRNNCNDVTIFTINIVLLAEKNNNYYCFYVMPFIENLKKVGS